MLINKKFQNDGRYLCTTTLFSLEKNKFSLRFKLMAHQRLRFFESLVTLCFGSSSPSNIVLVLQLEVKRRYRALYLVYQGMLPVLSAHTDKIDNEVFRLFVFLGICFLTNVKLIYVSFLQAVFSYNSGLIK